MNTNYSLSIILPAYNEEDNIQKTIEDSLEFLEHQNIFTEYEVIVVDDGSTDETADNLKKFKNNGSFKIVTNPRNFGYGGALVSGIKQARFPWLLLMDSDGQFKISSIQDIAGYFSEYDIIAGYRYRRADSSYREFLGKTYTYLVNLIFGLKLTDVNCGFKLFKKEALHLNGAYYHAGVFFTDMFIKAKQNGHRIKEVPIEHYPRAHGKQTGANFNVIFKAVMDLVKLVFTKEKAS